jgi:hypothetical protein
MHPSVRDTFIRTAVGELQRLDDPDPKEVQQVVSDLLRRMATRRHSHETV